MTLSPEAILGRSNGGALRAFGAGVAAGRLCRHLAETVPEPG